MLRTFPAALLLTLLPIGAAAQEAAAVISAAAKAMGAEGLGAITYAGTANTGNFGQSKTISGPLQMTAITTYTRAIDLNQPASRAFGPTLPPAVPGQPAPQPGNFNQNITPTNTAWAQQLQIWVTPWGFLKGAAANAATVRTQRVGNSTYQVVTWSPAQKAPSGEAYRVIGYVNPQNMIDRVETWVEHPILGDLHIDTSYSGYQDVGGLKVPTRIAQKQAGMATFDATITSASGNPANLSELLTPPPAAGRGGAPGAAGPGRAGGPAAPPAVETQKLAEGVYRITGGYVALAVDMGDHSVVLEGGQNPARGQAVIDAARKAIPDKPIRFVVNSHPHFDHASGLAPFAAAGITIITHDNNRGFLEKALSGPRTLSGDALAKSNTKPRVEGAAEKRMLKGTRSIDLYHVQNLEHSDGMLIAHLPAERILFTADFNLPAEGQPISPATVSLVQSVERLKLDFETYVMVHAPNPDRPLTRADLMTLVKGGK